MEGSNDIYHKEEPPLPPRHRRARRFGRSESVPPSSDPANATTAGLPATGTHSLGTPITPVQMARQHMQMQPQQHLRRRRRRRGPQQSEQKMNRLIWALIGIVVGAYLAVLVASVVKNRFGWFAKKSAPAASVATTAAAITVTANTVSNRLIETDSGLPVVERVQNWTRGQKALEEVEALIRNGRTTVAREKLHQAEAWVPGAVDRVYGLSRLYMAERNYAEAEKLLLRVVEAQPSRADARNDLATVLHRNGRFADALAVAEWICQNDAYSEDGHSVAADSALELGDTTKAIEHLRKLSNLRSDDLAVRNNLGIAYLRAGNQTEAAKIFEGILQQDDRNPTAHYNMALVLTKQGKGDEAVRLLSVAANRLGRNFVGSWMSSAEFDGLKANPSFIALQKECAAAPASSNAPPDVVRPHA